MDNPGLRSLPAGLRGSASQVLHPIVSLDQAIALPVMQRGWDLAFQRSSFPAAARYRVLIGDCVERPSALISTGLFLPNPLQTRCSLCTTGPLTRLFTRGVLAFARLAECLPAHVCSRRQGMPVLLLILVDSDFFMLNIPALLPVALFSAQAFQAFLALLHQVVSVALRSLLFAGKEDTILCACRRRQIAGSGVVPEGVQEGPVAKNRGVWLYHRPGLRIFRRSAIASCFSGCSPGLFAFVFIDFLSKILTTTKETPFCASVSSSLKESQCQKSLAACERNRRVFPRKGGSNPLPIVPSHGEHSLQRKEEQRETMHSTFHHLSALLRKLFRFLHTLRVYGLEYDTIIRSSKTALVIGTLLGLINHGQALISGHFTWGELVPLLITYLVPFSVTTYGQVQGKRQRDKLWANKREGAGRETTMERQTGDFRRSAVISASSGAADVARPPTGASR